MMDAGNLLKPMLSRGELWCIGETTLDKNRKYVEKDPAFERRFQQVLVKEPSEEETLYNPWGIRERHETHCGLQNMDTALVAAGSLSRCDVSRRFLPDNAIDIVDEACPMLYSQLNSQSEEIDTLERRKTQFEGGALARCSGKLRRAALGRRRRRALRRTGRCLWRS